MPTVNGTWYRTHGQGARAENEKSAAKTSESRSVDPEVDPTVKDKNEAASTTHIKDHGDGNYSVKHSDGEVTKHSSKSDMLSQLDSKMPDRGGDEVPDDDQTDSDFGSEGSSEAIKTLLG